MFKGLCTTVAIFLVALLSFSSALICDNSKYKRISTCRRPLFALTLMAKQNRRDEGQSSRLVQQEQLFEELSRKNAEAIASLSISERTKRAMLAEAVEDEIFSVAEQMVDLVQQNEAQSNGELLVKFEEQVKDLKTRNSFLQKQYHDLVSGRPSSLLNTVESVSVNGDNENRNDRPPYPLDENEFK